MMATDVACFIPEGVSQCSGHYHKTITTDRACFIRTERISPCSDCCHEMMPTVRACLGDEIPCSVYCCGMMTTDRAFLISEGVSPCSYSCHATSTTDRACFIPEGISPCSDCCHEMMTTDGVYFIPEGYHHALNVAMRWWQLMEQVSYLQDHKQCSIRWQRMRTTARACFIPKGVTPCSDPCYEMVSTDGA